MIKLLRNYQSTTQNDILKTQYTTAITDLFAIRTVPTHKMCLFLSIYQANDEFRLKCLLDTQISATREKWLDNLVHVVFTFKPLVDIDIDEDYGDEGQERQLMNKLDQELQQEKDNMMTQCKGYRHISDIKVLDLNGKEALNLNFCKLMRTL